MICWSCNSENADANSYCAHCGVSLDPTLEKFDSYIDDRIAVEIGKKLRDQKLVEYEVGEAVVVRLLSWGRGLAILVGLIISMLGYFGFSEISGTSAFVRDAKKQIEIAKVKIESDQSAIAAEVEGAARAREQAERLAAKLKKRIAGIETRVKEAELSIYSKNADATPKSSSFRISEWIWPNGIGGSTNATNFYKLRNWINQYMDEGLSIAFFLGSRDLKKKESRQLRK